VNMLCFGQFNPPCYSPFFTPSLPPPHYSVAFSIYRYILTCTDVKYFDIVNYYSFFLSFLP
jgi:hypothetical protein